MRRDGWQRLRQLNGRQLVATIQAFVSKSQVGRGAARPNSVNRYIRELRIAQDQPQLCVAREILRLSYNQHHSPVISWPRFQLLHGLGHPIVQPHFRRVELHFRDRLLYVVMIVRERLPDLHRAVSYVITAASPFSAITVSVKMLPMPRITGAIIAMCELVSITSATARGSSPRSQRSMVCSVPSSKTWKSFCERSRINSPCGSVTVTAAITSFVMTRIWGFAEGATFGVWLRRETTSAALNDNASAHRNPSLPGHHINDVYAISVDPQRL
jgi:hypothetical protein